MYLLVKQRLFVATSTALMEFLLHGENIRLFGCCPSVARGNMMKFPLGAPGEHVAVEGSSYGVI